MQHHSPHDVVYHPSEETIVSYLIEKVFKLLAEETMVVHQHQFGFDINETINNVVSPEKSFLTKNLFKKFDRHDWASQSHQVLLTALGIPKKYWSILSMYPITHYLTAHAAFHLFREQQIKLNEKDEKKILKNIESSFKRAFKRDYYVEEFDTQRRFCYALYLKHGDVAQQKKSEQLFKQLIGQDKYEPAQYFLARLAKQTNAAPSLPPIDELQHEIMICDLIKKLQQYQQAFLEEEIAENSWYFIIKRKMMGFFNAANEKKIQENTEEIYEELTHLIADLINHLKNDGMKIFISQRINTIDLHIDTVLSLAKRNVSSPKQELFSLLKKENKGIYPNQNQHYSFTPDCKVDQHIFKRKAPLIKKSFETPYGGFEIFWRCTCVTIGTVVGGFGGAAIGTMINPGIGSGLGVLSGGAAGGYLMNEFAEMTAPIIINFFSKINYFLKKRFLPNTISILQKNPPARRIKPNHHPLPKPTDTNNKSEIYLPSTPLNQSQTQSHQPLPQNCYTGTVFLNKTYPIYPRGFQPTNQSTNHTQYQRK